LFALKNKFYDPHFGSLLTDSADSSGYRYAIPKRIQPVIDNCYVAI
jgi:hypothetical protein